MTAISWNTGISGAWGTAADWSGGVVPGAGDSVSIAAAGTYTVTIGAGTSYQVGTLALGAAGATLDLLGTLALGSMFTVGMGDFILDTGGLLSGGMLRVTPTTGVVTYNGGTLSNVSFQGTMDLSAASAAVTEIGGIAFAGATGTGAGTVKLTGAGASFIQSGSGTLNNATVLMGNTTTADTLSVLDTSGSGLLDLGSTLTLDDATGTALLQDSGGSGDEIVNQGVIIVSGTGTGAASLAISGNELYNVRAIDDASNSVIGTAAIASGTVTGALSISDATLLNYGTLAVNPTASAATVVGKTFTALASNSLSISGNLFNNASLLSVAASANTTGTSAATASGTLNVSSSSFTNTGTIALSASAGTSGTGTATTGAASASGTVVISSASFLNAGTISINGTTTSSATKPGKLTATDKLTISSTSFTNTGLISVGGNSTKSTLTIGANAVSATGTTPAVAATNWVNTGTISATTGTVDLFGNFTLGAFNHAGATVLIGGYDNNAGNTLTVGGSAGGITAGNGLSNTTPAEILPGGYITGGTIVDQGLGLINNYDTLDGVTYQGTLAVDQAGTNVTIVDGITLQGLGGTGPGAISIGGTITGTSAQYTNTYLYTYGNTTLDNATITMGSNNTTHTSKGVATIVNNSSYINVGESTNAGGTIVAGQLTFGPNLLLTEYASANYVQVQNQALDNTQVWTTTPYAAGDAITNNGTFQLNSATGTMDVQAQNFSNNGTILLSNGGTFEIDTYNQTNNAGTIIANGGALLIDVNATGPAGTQTVIPTASGGTQTITTYQTNSFTNSGTVLATGTEVQLGGTLTAGWLAHFSATGGQTYLQQYAYANDAGAVLKSGAGTSGAANQLVLGGTIIGGTIDDGGNGLVAAGGTLDGVTYAGNLDPVSEAAYTDKFIDIKDGITLTGAGGSGPGTVTLANGISLLGIGNTTLDNAAISLGAGATLGEAATSHGTFAIGGGATLTDTAASATLQGGTGASDVFSNIGSIYLSGAGDTLTLTGITFDNIGKLVITGGVVADAATSTNNTGQIALQGGTLITGGLTNAGGIGGYGLIESGAAIGTLTNTGLIYGEGALAVEQGVSGAGTLAEVYGTLTLGGAATGGTLLFEQTGTIVLDQASLVQDAIAGLSAGDVLDLANLSGASAQLAGGTLSVAQAGAGTLAYLAGNTAGLTVGASADGQGGTAIEVFNLAQASISPATVAFGNVHVGGSVASTLSVTNTAPGLLSETLDASVTGSGGVTASGSFTGLAAGGTDSTDLVVGLNTSVSGAISGAAVVSLFSDGQGVDGNGATAIGTQTVQVTGAVFAYATPTINASSVNLGAVRVGGSLAGSFTLGDGTAANAYQESLVYALSGAVGSASGTILAGSTAALGVSLATGTSGTIASTGTLALVSTGVGTSGLADTSLGSDTLTVTGKVFQAASAALSTQTVAFGNVHVGDTVSQSLGVTNTATGALVDHLLVAASEGGAGFSGGGSLNLASGAGGTLAVGLNTSVAGDYTGTLALGLTSHDLTLADLSLNTQTVALSGAVYAYAAPNLGTAALDLGAVRTGGALAGSVTLGDGTVANAYQESLVFSLSGDVGSGGGTIASGGSTSIGVSLDSSASGTVAGTGTLALVSTGVGTSGLADTSLAPETVSVTGTVYQTAAESLSAQTLNFGNVHAGSTIAGSLTLTNIASGALVDDLLGTYSVTGGGFSGGGTLDLGAAASGQLTASFDPAATGVQNGDVTVDLTSHDSALADIALAAQTVSLTGTVYAYAAPVLSSNTQTLGAVRVGLSLAGGFTLSNGGPQDAYQESLIYALGGNQGTIGSGGDATLQLALATDTSGTITTTGTVALTSDGQTDGLGNTALPNQTVSVSGTVYQTAAAALSSTSVSFGITHVGQMETATLVVGNSATGALVDQLLASLSGFAGPFSAGSNGATIASLQNGTLTIDFLASAAGVFSGSAALALASFDDDLGSLGLSGDTITLSGTADNYAQSLLGAVSGPGTFTASGNTATLNLGTPVAGSAAETLSITNSASGPADLLGGSFTVTGDTGAFSGGLGTFTNLSAGQAYDFSIGLNASDLSGTYSETIVLTPTGYNASGYSGTLAAETLTVTGSVIGTYALTTGVDTVAAGAGTDFIYAATNTLSAGDSINGGGGANTLVLTGAGKFDLALPATLTNIGSVQATELSTGEQVVTLRKGTAAQDIVTSVASGSISIIGAANSDTITLGNGADSIVLGGSGETVIGGSGTDTYTVTGKTIAAAINAGTGTNLLEVTGGGKVAMGTSLTGSFASATLLGSGTTFTANTQANLAIIVANTGDSVTVGNASQSVSAQGGQTVHVLATAAQAGVLVSNVGTGSVLEITSAGTSTLNNGDSGITVLLDKAGVLNLGTIAFATGIGSNGPDTIVAGAANQTLTGGLGRDELVGYTGGGDRFSDVVKGLNGDSIVNFVSSDVVDITNLGTVTKQSFVSSGGSVTTAHLTGSSGSLSFTFDGHFTGTFSVVSDGHGGDLITYH